jgi:hypothetical protein
MDELVALKFGKGELMEKEKAAPETRKPVPIPDVEIGLGPADRDIGPPWATPVPKEETDEGEENGSMRRVRK